MTVLTELAVLSLLAVFTVLDELAVLAVLALINCLSDCPFLEQVRISKNYMISNFDQWSSNIMAEIKNLDFFEEILKQSTQS